MVFKEVFIHPSNNPPLKLWIGNKWKTYDCLGMKRSPVADRITLYFYSTKIADKSLSHPNNSSFPFFPALRRICKDIRNCELSEITADNFYGLQISAPGVEPSKSFDKTAQNFYAEKFILTILIKRHRKHVPYPPETLNLAFLSLEYLQTWMEAVREQTTLEREFSVNVLYSPIKSKVKLGPAKLHILDGKFCIVCNSPLPTMLGTWKIAELRRFGKMGTKFCFEAGSSNGIDKSGIYILISNPETIDNLDVTFMDAANGKMKYYRPDVIDVSKKCMNRGANSINIISNEYYTIDNYREQLPPSMPIIDDFVINGNGNNDDAINHTKYQRPKLPSKYYSLPRRDKIVKGSSLSVDDMFQGSCLTKFNKHYSSFYKNSLEYLKCIRSDNTPSFKYDCDDKNISAKNRIGDARSLRDISETCFLDDTNSNYRNLKTTLGGHVIYDDEKVASKQFYYETSNRLYLIEPSNLGTLIHRLSPEGKSDTLTSSCGALKTQQNNFSNLLQKNNVNSIIAKQNFRDNHRSFNELWGEKNCELNEYCTPTKFTKMMHYDASNIDLNTKTIRDARKLNSDYIKNQQGKNNSTNSIYEIMNDIPLSDQKFANSEENIYVEMDDIVNMKLESKKKYGFTEMGVSKSIESKHDIDQKNKQASNQDINKGNNEVGKCKYNNCDCHKYWAHLPLRPFLPYNFHELMIKKENEKEYHEKIKGKYTHNFSKFVNNFSAEKKNMLNQDNYVKNENNQFYSISRVSQLSTTSNDKVNKIKDLLRVPLKFTKINKTNYNARHISEKIWGGNIKLFKSSSFSSTNNKISENKSLNMTSLPKRLYNSLTEITNKAKYKPKLRNHPHNNEKNDLSKSKKEEFKQKNHSYQNNELLLKLKSLDHKFPINKAFYGSLPVKSKITVH